MKWSEITLKTLRENPADAEMESHRLFMRGGLIKKLAPGIFSYGYLFLRSVRKFENILREELSKAGCQEILMPMVQPASLWQESGRWPKMGELLKFKNKNNHDFCLGATHEEVVVDFVRNDIKSYRDLPANIYQIQTKYRDEIRPRFGLMRGREFVMKDAYSFDRDKEGALKSYEKMRQAYVNIFKRLGVEFTMVKADSGAIGGDLSNEFQVVAEHGMDHVLLCKNCGYSANSEIAPLILDSITPQYTQEAMVKFATPNLKTIEDLEKSLKIPAQDLVKTFFVKFQDKKDKWKEATLLVAGDREVNLIKAKTVLEASSDLEPLSDIEVEKLTGSKPGSCGPVGLSNIIIMDPSLKKLKSFIVGANEEGQHLKNVVPGRDFVPTKEADISQVKGGDPCPECKEPLLAKRGIEVGHIFYLGKKYSEPMGLKYLDEGGKAQVVEMGCYGVGVTRSLQAIIEQSHDGDGMAWPKSVTPFHIHICSLDPEDKELEAWIEEYQKSLENKSYEVFIDDRKERPGIKFKDADLLGFPLRVVVGRKGFDNNELELFVRKSKEKIKVTKEEVLNKTFSIMESVF
jgi:prolyl-tRNA synthetase